jgi:hypothetical protein
MFNVVDPEKGDDIAFQQKMAMASGKHLGRRVRGILKHADLTWVSFADQPPKHARTCMDRTFVFFSFEPSDEWLSSNPNIFFWAVVYQLLNIVMISASVINLVVSTDPVFWDKVRMRVLHMLRD